MVGIGPAKFVQGLFWNINYLLMKTTNEADSPFSLPSNNFNLRADRAPAVTDFRHLISGFVSKRLPMGFAASTIFQATSALPYNITTGFDDNGDTVSNDRPAGTGRNSARGAGRWDVGTRVSYGFGFGGKRAASAPSGPVVIRVGEGGGASFPGANDQKFRVDLYAQFFNVLNHANLTNFSGVQTSPFFGRATAALPGRRVETGLRFSF